MSESWRGIALGFVGVIAILSMDVSICNAVPAKLHVSGNHLQNSAGKAVRLKGVNIMGYEYSPEGDHVAVSVTHALDWNPSILRLPINQDYWMGYGATASTYRAAIDSVVKTAAAKDCYVIVDLHWSDAGQWGKNNGQHNMPDDNTVTAWSDIAAHYKDNPAVLFGVYNEPHDIEWPLWRDGGMVTNDKNTNGQLTGLNYHTPGIQGLIDTIRKTGAGNVLVVGGIGYAGTLDGVVKSPADGGFRPWDPGPGGKQKKPNQNILYDAHIYPFSYTDWDGRVTVAANAGLPVYIGEFGGRRKDGTAWDDKMINWIESHNYSATAWCFYGGDREANPDSLDLLKSWNFDASEWHGVPVKNWLAK